MNDGGAVGIGVARLDAADKVTGGARYVDDLKRAGMLHAAVATSPLAHARIRGYRIDAARAVSGVKAVLIGPDLPQNRVGNFIKDETTLAHGKVRYVGEPVAAVAATSLQAARLAAQLIELDYEELPSALSIESALAEEAPLIHEELASYVAVKPGKSRGNIVWDVLMAEGDVDSAWSKCDVIVEGEFRTQAQHHAYLEPNGVLADIDANGRLTIWSSCQSVFHVQQRVAEELGIPMSRVRALVPRVGGGFGGKHATNLQTIAAALALKTHRPVKLVLSRSQDFEMQRSRHPARLRMRTGAMRDGTIVARDTEVVLDGGAYADESPAVVSFAALMSRGPYLIPNVRCRGIAVYTNKLRAGAYRGFGNPQVTFAGESQIDELAGRLGMDPVELRLKNMMRAGDRWFGGQSVTRCRAAECLKAVAEAARAAPALPVRTGRKRAFGYAAATHICGMMGVGASVQLKADGTVALATGVVDIGQGSDTVLTQICAEALQLPIESVSFGSPDTDISPYNWKTAGSRITYMAGRAVAGAAGQVRDKILEHAAEMLECAPADLELRPGGRVGIVGVSGKEITFQMVAGRSLYRVGGPIIGTHSLVYDGERFDPKRATVEFSAFDNPGVYTFGALAVEVEVDTITGKVEVRRAWSAHDVGRAINPLSVEGQIQGAVVQGLGYALSEEMIWDDDGRLANPTLAEYALPGLADVPEEIVPIIVEDPEPTGPFGARGVGEIPLVGVAAAVANAVAAATAARIRQLPLTPERVLEAMAD